MCEGANNRGGNSCHSESPCGIGDGHEKASKIMKEHHLQSNLDFRLMSMEFGLRDWLRPPVKILQEAGVCSGMTVLDFGCGPGGFSLAAARMVGPQGRVYAVDMHPLAVKSVRAAAMRKALNNIETIPGNGLVDIPAGSVDIVLLYDVLHDLSDPIPIQMEWHRVLKPKGILSVSDHHLKGESLLQMITGGGLFRLADHGRRLFQFEKAKTPEAAT